MKLDKKSLKVLVEALPTDAVTQISERVNYSKSLIQKVLAGTRHNVEILEAAIEVAKETKEKKEALRNEIMELVS